MYLWSGKHWQNWMGNYSNIINNGETYGLNRTIGDKLVPSNMNFNKKLMFLILPTFLPNKSNSQIHVMLIPLSMSPIWVLLQRPELCTKSNSIIFIFRASIKSNLLKANKVITNNNISYLKSWIIYIIIIIISWLKS
jgi:hypothetical protein